ncbi:hypothetical protein B0J12DRAFT_307695 [Macrophomina phaseolina]|uniref:RelA/SpoT domain-containing protein n=1 Tax=Macrophomina phaseolina TaxID=35725 RepID=A0ABQ8FX13_9PEZI|nr:hypothetical protein B0J12DRAFT_307695 [Macrophomina phaseolina]
MAGDQVITAEPVEAVDIIEDFLKTYTKERDYYGRLAEHVKSICENFLSSSAHDALVTCRAKGVRSLRNKLYRRHPEKQYRAEQEIKADIQDLVGVRISLFFPHHKDEVDAILSTKFDVREQLNHPKPAPKGDITEANEFMNAETGRKTAAQKDSARRLASQSDYENRFRGYQATHYRVLLSGESRSRYFDSTELIEIQVMSVLHSAWSEVEHNILYKRLKGTPSFPERQMLDGLSGLVSVGELYLEQLHTMYKSRIRSDEDLEEPFANKYELGTFLFAKLRDAGLENKYSLSSVELLRKFLSLKCVALNTKRKLDAKLRDINLAAGFRSRFDNPNCPKPNICLLIMEHLYFVPGKDLRPRAPEADEKDLCSILISTIISLDELFPPVHFWEGELTDKERESSSPGASLALENLKWLVRDQAPKNVFLGHKDPLTREEKEKLNQLWGWFRQHPSQIVRFVFDVSRLGVLRQFPEDIALLERTYHLIKDYFEE